jgi:hypothetical protein
MKDVLLRVVSSPAVRKTFYALILAVLAALGISLGTGCGAAVSVPPAVAKAQALLACQIAALETVVPLSVAEDVAMAVRAGNHEYAVRQLLGLGLTPEAIKAAADAFNACAEPEPAPEVDASAPPVEITPA